MTNGENIKVLLNPREDQIKIYGDWVEIEIQSLAINFSCSLDWWNAEYKEPTTKNDLSSGLENVSPIIDWNKCHTSEQLNSIATTKNDLGVDCISRQAALDITWNDPSYSDPLNVLTEIRDKIRELHSVIPIRPKGKWIQQIEEDVDGELLSYWECSKCGRIVGHNMADIKDVINDYPFCHCGADMREVVEE